MCRLAANGRVARSEPQRRAWRTFRQTLHCASSAVNVLLGSRDVADRRGTSATPFAGGSERATPAPAVPAASGLAVAAGAGRLGSRIRMLAEWREQCSDFSIFFFGLLSAGSSGAVSSSPLRRPPRTCGKVPGCAAPSATGRPRRRNAKRRPGMRATRPAMARPARNRRPAPPLSRTARRSKRSTRATPMPPSPCWIGRSSWIRSSPRPIATAAWPGATKATRTRRSATWIGRSSSPPTVPAATSIAASLISRRTNSRRPWATIPRRSSWTRNTRRPCATAATSTSSAATRISV